jgi:hypothetical protein
MAQVWTDRTPRLQWETRPLNIAEAKDLLRMVCPNGLKEGSLEGKPTFSCVVPKIPIQDQEGKVVPSRRFEAREFQPSKVVATGESPGFQSAELQSVIYGHFLSPTSEDAALSGWAGESHPSFFGGTLLLTRSAGNWHPVWYKSAVISRYCRKVVLATGREILICEEEDGGMGHSYHILYGLDFMNPKSPFDAALLVADSYLLMCEEQQAQSIESIRFQPPGHSGEVSVFLRHGRKRLSEQDRNNCADGKPLLRPRVQDYRVDFLIGEQLQVAPSSRNRLKPFIFR